MPLVSNLPGSTLLLTNHSHHEKSTKFNIPSQSQQKNKLNSIAESKSVFPSS